MLAFEDVIEDIFALAIARPMNHPGAAGPTYWEGVPKPGFVEALDAAAATGFAVKRARVEVEASVACWIFPTEDAVVFYGEEKGTRLFRVELHESQAAMRKSLRARGA